MVTKTFLSTVWEIVQAQKPQEDETNEDGVNVKPFVDNCRKVAQAQQKELDED